MARTLPVASAVRWRGLGISACRRVPVFGATGTGTVIGAGMAHDDPAAAVAAASDTAARRRPLTLLPVLTALPSLGRLSEVVSKLELRLLRVAAWSHVRQ
jgi:hypothetical protein